MPKAARSPACACLTNAASVVRDSEVIYTLLTLFQQSGDIVGVGIVEVCFGVGPFDRVVFDWNERARGVVGVVGIGGDELDDPGAAGGPFASDGVEAGCGKRDDFQRDDLLLAVDFASSGGGDAGFFWRMAGGDLDEGDPVFCLDFGVGGGVADDESERACEEIGCKAGEGG